MNTPGSFKKSAVSSDSFLRARLQLVQRRLEAEYHAHVSTRQANFDSGLPLEDVFRAELAELLRPFVVDVGSVVDRAGNTPGEGDVVILEPRLSPLLLAAPTPFSRKKWFTFESTYGIVEVKQTLTLGASDLAGNLVATPSGSLWQACTKIFGFKQLEREDRPAVMRATNAPVGIVFCYSCDVDTSSGEGQDALLRDFLAANSAVPPQQRVDAIYVLNKFILTWSFLDKPQERRFNPLQHPHESPRPAWATIHPTGEDTLYSMLIQLWDTITKTQLAPPDLLNCYGGRSLIDKDMRAMILDPVERERLPPVK
jgi:hypothetical protein